MKAIFIFGKFSSAGQDFGFYIDNEKTLGRIASNILRYYEYFDVSYEAYLWLDKEGHGKNGAPYDMKDVYEDMIECESFIYELYEIFMNYIFEFEAE